MLHFHVVIPARFGSSRLPRKPLLPIDGKPMVVRVAEQAAKSGAQQIWVATDHPSILGVVQAHGFQACMTQTSHASGTDRIAEVAEQQQWPDETIIVNVQGDEPFIPPQLIRDVAQHLHDHPKCDMSTACHAIHDLESLCNPNVVKVILDKQGDAWYFSRAPIPYARDALRVLPSSEGRDDCPSSLRGEVGRGEVLPSSEGRDDCSSALPGGRAERGGFGRGGLPQNFSALRHIGIYAYRAGFLRAFHQLAPAAIEQIESLEQLRVLWHGYKIGVFVNPNATPGGVDTEQDLIAARKQFESGV